MIGVDRKRKKAVSSLLSFADDDVIEGDDDNELSSRIKSIKTKVKSRPHLSLSSAAAAAVSSMVAVNNAIDRNVVESMTTANVYDEKELTSLKSHQNYRYTSMRDVTSDTVDGKEGDLGSITVIDIEEEIARGAAEIMATDDVNYEGIIVGGDDVDTLEDLIEQQRMGLGNSIHEETNVMSVRCIAELLSKVTEASKAKKNKGKVFFSGIKHEDLEVKHNLIKQSIGQMDSSIDSIAGVNTTVEANDGEWEAELLRRTGNRINESAASNYGRSTSVVHGSIDSIISSIGNARNHCDDMLVTMADRCVQLNKNNSQYADEANKLTGETEILISSFNVLNSFRSYITEVVSMLRAKENVITDASNSIRSHFSGLMMKKINNRKIVLEDIVYRLEECSGSSSNSSGSSSSSGSSNSYGDYKLVGMLVQERATSSANDIVVDGFGRSIRCDGSDKVSALRRREQQRNLSIDTVVDDLDAVLEELNASEDSNSYNDDQDERGILDDNVSKVSNMFDDVREDLCSVSLLLCKFSELRVVDPVRYKDAYVSLSVPGLLQPYVEVDALHAFMWLQLQDYKFDRAGITVSSGTTAAFSSSSSTGDNAHYNISMRLWCKALADFCICEDDVGILSNVMRPTILSSLAYVIRECLDVECSWQCHRVASVVQQLLSTAIGNSSIIMGSIKDDLVATFTRYLLSDIIYYSMSPDSTSSSSDSYGKWIEIYGYVLIVKLIKICDNMIVFQGILNAATLGYAYVFNAVVNNLFRSLNTLLCHLLSVSSYRITNKIHTLIHRMCNLLADHTSDKMLQLRNVASDDDYNPIVLLRVLQLYFFHDV